jgi:hypothetical protein
MIKMATLSYFEHIRLGCIRQRHRTSWRSLFHDDVKSRARTRRGESGYFVVNNQEKIKMSFWVSEHLS